MAAQPVLKWAGGKRQLLSELLARTPAKIRTYYEPFIGGGALFFELANQGRFKHAVINDANGELVNLYTVIQSRLDELLVTLRNFHHTEADYYQVRACQPTQPVALAARTIYLNRTGFNGLYRVNKKGRFNVPFGRYKNPTICNEPVLRAASEALQGARVMHGDFDAACLGAEEGDFVYLDPPYLPVSSTSNFAAYHASTFGDNEHRRLNVACQRLRRDGVEFLVSNSDTPLVREIFAELHIETVGARRNINSVGSKRGAVSEVLMSSGTRRIAAA